MKRKKCSLAKKELKKAKDHNLTTRKVINIYNKLMTNNIKTSSRLTVVKGKFCYYFIYCSSPY